METQKTLKEIVETKDLAALEVFALYRTHRQVMEEARRQCVDYDELEEMLYAIS